MVCPFITPSLHDRITSYFHLWSLTKEIPLQSITSSIYRNCHISIIHCRIEFKLVLVKAEWRLLLFCKKTLPVSQTWRRKAFNYGYLLLYVPLSLNLVWEIWDIHVTLRLYQISCGLEVHLNLLGQLQGKWVFFLYRLICPFIIPSMLDLITSNFQRWP